MQDIAGVNVRDALEDLFGESARDVLLKSAVTFQKSVYACTGYELHEDVDNVVLQYGSHESAKYAMVMVKLGGQGAWASTYCTTFS